MVCVWMGRVVQVIGELLEVNYHNRPPDSGFVRRKGPNIMVVRGVWDWATGWAWCSCECRALKRLPRTFLARLPSVVVVFVGGGGRSSKPAHLQDPIRLDT